MLKEDCVRPFFGASSVAEQHQHNLDRLAARLGVEWARRVRETFRQLRTTIPPSWPGTRAGARSLGDRICGDLSRRAELERVATIIEQRAAEAWRQIRCLSGEEQGPESGVTSKPFGEDSEDEREYERDDKTG